ncbi:phosphatase PAP2 family protein [Conexibacter sp. JD483]|uniref:phosphatase PAP2 family protein n=1 Tax=unclassified Conexibacter TaxID=2627773 RepID=UPI0027293B66|nr:MULTISPECIES: phosphatase PAP2 family protein [unclassified Conexibacter]MDO8184712.1 phosphatase PAP2 family protein [Conexibacter sp. CPCC 205706]MDO8198018.1 phosphatase PAP2 family protein [Conexibacter sp. CPCC 205762]MDR9372317.1 phosphatase PAP2 family protein [Conexibacter sp. JD483]
MDRRTTLALRGAAVTAALLPLVYLTAVHLGPVHWLDAAILNGFTNLNGPRVEPLAIDIATLCDPDTFVWLVAALIAVALLRRRPRTAAAVAIVLLGANVTTQLLKPALASDRVSPLLDDVGQILPASWPSGHATASMSLALCAVLVAPARLRPWTAALGAVFAVAVTFSFLTLDWHYPSDVLGGFLVAATWTQLAVAALSAAQARWPERRERVEPPPLREALAPSGVTAACAALLAAMVLIARPAQVVAYAQEHTAFVVGAGALAVVALTLAAGLSLLTLRAPRR